MEKKKVEMLTLGAGTLAAAVAGAAEYLSEEVPLIEETIMAIGTVAALGAGLSKLLFKKSPAEVFNVNKEVKSHMEAEEVEPIL